MFSCSQRKLTAGAQRARARAKARGRGRLGNRPARGRPGRGRAPALTRSTRKASAVGPSPGRRRSVGPRRRRGSGRSASPAAGSTRRMRGRLPRVRGARVATRPSRIGMGFPSLPFLSCHRYHSRHASRAHFRLNVQLHVNVQTIQALLPLSRIEQASKTSSS